VHIQPIVPILELFRFDISTVNMKIIVTIIFWIIKDILFSFSNSVLNISNSINNLGDVQWPLLLALLLAWSMVYLMIIRGPQSIGKVSKTFIIVICHVSAHWCIMHTMLLLMTDSKENICRESWRYQWIIRSHFTITCTNPTHGKVYSIHFW
jgi:hypothetical protein